MYRCLIWGMGNTFLNNINIIKYYESCAQIKVAGVTANDLLYSSIFGYDCVHCKCLDYTKYDIVIVAVSEKKYLQVYKSIKERGFSQDVIIPIKVLKIYNFNFTDYLKIKKAHISIFANNCWGGTLYHYLGLRFDSPMINMFFEDNDFLKFLEPPKKYIDSSLILDGMKYNEDIQINYPVFMCEDIKIYFNHYDDVKSAINTWEKRKHRINWDNIFVMMFTENKSVAKRFLETKYAKKICFVPFKIDNKYSYTINYKENIVLEKEEFYAIVNGSAAGRYTCFDVLKLILEGEIQKTAFFADSEA